MPTARPPFDPAAVAATVFAAELEAQARISALAMIRAHGVTKPLLALRAMPPPLNPLQRLVLAKVEAVAVHLGSP